MWLHLIVILLALTVGLGAAVLMALLAWTATSTTLHLGRSR